MKNHPFNDLTPAMQKRLDIWRKNVLPVKSAEKIRGPSPLKRRYVRGDYGDDISDFEQKFIKETK